MLPPVIGIVLVLVILGGLMAALRVWQQRCAPHSELVRKLLHIGMGLVSTALPWLFAEVWPVLVVSALATLVMVAVRANKKLGAVVGSVERASLGEVYFPIGVGVTFACAQGDKLLYAVPMLVLTLADATGALIGIQFGAHPYRATEGRKSAEGSAAFFAVAFASVLVPLWLVPIEPAKALLIAAILGLLVMALEAIAWRGLDNLFIPLGAFILLKIFLQRDLAALFLRLGLALALFGFMLVWRRRTTLNDSAVLGAAFAAYVFGAVGGWRWLIAPLTVLMSYPVLMSPRTRRNSRRVHTVHGVISVVAAGLVWVFLAGALDRPDFFYPYTVSFACHLAMIGVARLRSDFPQMSVPALLLRCAVRSWVLILGPYWLLEKMTRIAAIHTAIALAPITIAMLFFYFSQPGMDDCPTDTPRWLRQALSAAAGSVLGLLVLILS